MKRSWMGLGLLLLLLALGLLTTWVMGNIHEPVARNLEQAAEFTSQGNRTAASACFVQARTNWEQWSRLRSCLADHSPVEEIDAAFARLQVYCAAREDAAFAADCRELAKKVAAVGDAHGLLWWNLL